MSRSTPPPKSWAGVELPEERRALDRYKGYVKAGGVANLRFKEDAWNDVSFDGLPSMLFPRLYPHVSPKEDVKMNVPLWFRG